MPAITAKYRLNAETWATFEGRIWPEGATGYGFEGTITATTMLDRSDTSFPNKVRLGHGGTKGKYERLEFEIKGVEKENSFEVRGRGTREHNDTVDFYVGLNNKSDGSWEDGAEITTVVGGPPQKIEPAYNSSKGHNAWFEGSVRADGPTGYAITGMLYGSATYGSNFRQESTFGYKAAGGSWAYETTTIPVNIDVDIHGTRGSGEDIVVLVGASTGTLGAYEYSSELRVSLPEEF
ncbi:hypothetical protein ACWGFX_18305 [Streptomyces xanthophaeus]